MQRRVQAGREGSDTQVKNPHTLANVLNSHYNAMYAQGLRNLSNPGDTMDFTNPYQIKAQVHPICAKCQERPPEGVMGLWKLHNMDYIQAGVSH